jgi:uncharacterized membrane protein
MPSSGGRVSAPTARIAIVDVARGVALLAMAVYHFAWDLEFFGYAEPGMTADGGWKMFARAIASSFLFLVGFSLVLAHGQGVRWPGFRRRWLQVAASAAAITAATWYAFPETFIFFGILHQIALASLLGLAFLRMPAVVTVIVAAAVIALPWLWRGIVFDAPWLLWVGLPTQVPRSNDYVPLFPWFGAVLLGIAAATLARRAGLLPRLATIDPPAWTRPLAFAGRHSLAVYLIHQPVLIGALWLVALVVPPDLGTPQERFIAACDRTCTPLRDAIFCQRYCACMLDSVVVADRLDEAFGEGQNAGTQAWLGAVAGQCTTETEAWQMQAGPDREQEEGSEP